MSERLEFDEDGIPRPVYCNPTTQNPPGKANDARCGWGNGSPTLGTFTLVSTNNQSMFDMWYRDAPTYNMRSGGVLSVDAVAGSPGVYQYASAPPSPSGAGWHPLDALPPCNLSTATPWTMDCSNGGKHFPLQYMLGGSMGENTVNHTFAFTTELHTFFTYTGVNQMFEFAGDDDAWVYVNNILAVDMGGLHTAAYSVIDLGNAVVAEYLGLEIGGIYALDIYNAERHTTQSNFKITTSLTYECSIIDSGASAYAWTPATLAQDWRLSGSASIVASSTIKLSSSLAANAVSFAALRQPLDVAYGFIASFSFTAGAQGSGFVFALVPPSVSSASGVAGALGFNEMNASWAVAFDFCADRASNPANPPCASRETRMHYLDVPLSANNVSAATQRARAALYLPNTLNDGFEHTVLVRYFGERPPWVEVYIDDSLFLVQRDIDMQAVLGGSRAALAFTASTGALAQEASDIAITDVQVTTVAVADENSRLVVPDAQLTAAADGITPVTFTLKTYDLCGNAVGSGGHADRAFAYLAEASTTINATVTDNGDGTYALAFTYNLVAAFDLYVYFGTSCFVNGNASLGLQLPLSSATCYSTTLVDAAAFVAITSSPTTVSPTSKAPSTSARPSKSPIVMPRYALAVTVSRRRALGLNATQIAQIETYLDGVLSSFTGASVQVDSMSALSASSYLVLYHFVSSSAAATPINATAAAALSTQIASDPANTFGITALAVTTTGSPTVAPTPKPPQSGSAERVAEWTIQGLLVWAAWRVGT